MTRSPDLLDRVSDANPVPDDATLSPDERQVAEALLARVLATPPDHTDPVPPRRRRTRAFVLAGAAASVVVALVLSSVLDRGPSLAERAYAAVSKPSLYHVVTDVTLDVPPKLRYLPLGGDHLTMESWYDLRRRAVHMTQFVVRDGRRTLSFEAATEGRRTFMRFSADDAPEAVPDDGEVDIEEFDPAETFRDAFKKGAVREDGTVTIDGRRANRFVIEDDRPSELTAGVVARSTRTIALFDADTDEPIRFIIEEDVASDGRRGTVTTRMNVTTWETLPRTAENLAKLKIPKPG